MSHWCVACRKHGRQQQTHHWHKLLLI